MEKKTESSAKLLADLKQHIETDYSTSGKSGKLKHCCGYNINLRQDRKFEAKVRYICITDIRFYLNNFLLY